MVLGRVLVHLFAGLAAAALPAERLLVGPCMCGPVRPPAERSAPAHACCEAEEAPHCSPGRMCCCRGALAARTGDGCGLRCNCRGTAPQSVPAPSRSPGQVISDAGLIGLAIATLPAIGSARFFDRGLDASRTATPLQRCSVLCRFLI